jgi:cell division protein FtsL
METGHIESSMQISTSNKFKKFLKDNPNFIIIFIVVFLFLLLFLFLSILFHFYNKHIRHTNEINQILDIEKRAAERQQQINDARTNTIICPIAHFNNPRNCYFGSNYRCHWNEDADRCNLID